MNRLHFLLVIFIVADIQVFGQPEICEKVYNTVEADPIYKGGMADLMDFFQKQLTPILSKYQKANEDLSAKVILTLTIDIEGKVIDVVLSKHKLPKDCEAEIKEKLLTMTDWKPGVLNGQKVCSRFAWVVSCIKWG